ncbi:hypothetical protein M0722_13805 [Microbacterium sp. KSW4-16]|uniref:hypothetical protein n=1 Tax=Microbacterium aurugineum TaxID=2851642 RepID=UPI0020BEB3F7|nr:hypothetical protein [Microbacterium aurugineum]MCK8468270.1 hypothetical protein [Microbacterium aurugineum]
MTGELSDAQRADLEQRLAEVQAELVEVSKARLSYTVSAFDPLRDKSETLEIEADSIRRELGHPTAFGRPPRADGIGWALLGSGAVVTVALIWLFAR